MKNNKTNYGIKINNKMPILDNQTNKYHSNIKFSFKGKAYIYNDKNTDYKEVKSGDTFKKNGKFIIKFVDEKGKVYLIKIKILKLDFVFILILLAFLVLIIFAKPFRTIERQMIFDSLSYDYVLIGDKYVFDINSKEQDYKDIRLFDKVSSNEKIYPGSSGYFYICMSTITGNKDLSYKMEVQEELNKPKNLKYRINGKTFNSIEELSKSIQGYIPKDSIKTLKIEWFWDYDALDDNEDTNDGLFNNNYNFSLRMIGSEYL